jgi:group I intron endonuclease
VYKNPKQVIYCLTNKMIFRQYVGSSSNFGHRKIDHLSRLKKHNHWIEKLQNDFDLFGEFGFEFFILEELGGLDKKQLEEKEQKWIDLLHPVYNLSLVAGSNIRTNAKAPGALEKMRKALTGRKQPPELVAKRAATMVKNGKHHLKRLTLEQKQHLSEINIGERNPNWGLYRSDETKRKQSEAIAKTYLGAISPNGQIYAPIHNMSRFCVEHGLRVSSMVALMHKRINIHKGWKRFEPGEPNQV